MTGRDDAAAPGPGHDPGQADVARLLAAAGGPVEVPADVAARLDDVLADLVQERGLGAGSADDVDPGPGAPAPVTELASRRRRWPRLLVAAAAVSVLGLGAGELLGDESQAERSVATADSTASSTPEVAPAPSTAGSPLPGAPLAARSDAPADAEAARDEAATAPHVVPRLRRESLTADLERVAAFAALGTVEDQRARADTACVRPRLASGDQVLVVRLDGAPAVLVMRAPEGGRRTAVVFTCDDAETPAVETRIDAR